MNAFEFECDPFDTKYFRHLDLNLNLVPPVSLSHIVSCSLAYKGRLVQVDKCKYSRLCELCVCFSQE